MRVRQAVLLVGGRGTRMWPLTATAPKALLPVMGTPFIELQFRLLAEVDVDHVILAVGADHAVAWRDYANSYSGPLEVEISVEESPLDTAGPLTIIRERLDESFLVLNGDVVLEGSLPRLVSRAPAASVVLAMVAVADPSAYGVIVTGADGRIERFVEKPPAEEAPTNLVNAGMYLIQREALAAYPVGPLSFERTVFPDLVRAGELGAVEIEGRWLDIGTPELYLQAHQAAAATGEGGSSWVWISPRARVSSAAAVSRSVVLGDAEVAAEARLDEAIIGWGARVGAAVIRDGAVVGAGAEIGNGCELAAGARVAPGAVLAEGSITFSPPE